MPFSLFVTLVQVEPQSLDKPTQRKPSMIRVLLADNRPLVYAGLQTVLQPVRDLQLLPEVAHQPWSSLCRQYKIDVLLVNAHLPGLHIESMLTEMRDTATQTAVLLLLETGQATSCDLHEILQSGGVTPFYRTTRWICGLTPCAL